jgi:hypothetical protein
MIDGGLDEAGRVSPRDHDLSHVIGILQADPNHLYMEQLRLEEVERLHDRDSRLTQRLGELLVLYQALPSPFVISELQQMQQQQLGLFRSPNGPHNNDARRSAEIFLGWLKDDRPQTEDEWLAMFWAFAEVVSSHFSKRLDAAMKGWQQALNLQPLVWPDGKPEVEK